MELMVAMAITTIIVTVLVSITSIALDTWNRSRSELRASRQAKALIDTMARDFESLVTRRGNSSEWLSAVGTSSVIGDSLPSTNAAELIFFTAVTDRYDGNLGSSSTSDQGGDISCVSYQLQYDDPMGSSNPDFQSFIVKRDLINPDVTFEHLLGKDDLESAYAATPGADINSNNNYICENVFQFTVTFHVQVTQITGGNSRLVNVPVTIGRTSGGNITSSFKVLGTGIDTEHGGSNGVTADELRAGRVAAMEISVTVLSDFGMNQMRRRTFAGAAQSEFLAEHSFQYSKVVQLPTL